MHKNDSTAKNAASRKINSNIVYEAEAEEGDTQQSQYELNTLSIFSYVRFAWEGNSVSAFQ